MRTPKLNEQQFLQAKNWIATNKAHALVEVLLLDTWDAGSRTAVYSAIEKGSFKECSLTEKVVLYETWVALCEKQLADIELATA